MSDKDILEKAQDLNIYTCTNMRLAQAYIPYQIMTRTFPPMEALQKGTLFPELYRPYRRRR